MVNTNTKIQVETHGGKRSSSSESLLDATQQASMTGKQKMDLFSAKMRSQFAGYTREVAEAIGTACLGLGGKYQLSECGGSKGLGKGLARPPKGMILYGPPGTGKSSLMRGLVSALGCEHVELSHSVLLSR